MNGLKDKWNDFVQHPEMVKAIIELLSIRIIWVGLGFDQMDKSSAENLKN